MICDLLMSALLNCATLILDWRIYVLSFSYTFSRIDMVSRVGESEMATINLHSNNNDVMSKKWR